MTISDQLAVAGIENSGELTTAAFADFVRLHVAGGAAADDTIEGYLREARLFRDRFLAPRCLAIAALTEEDIVAYRRELVVAGYAVTRSVRNSRRCVICLRPRCARVQSVRIRQRTLPHRAIGGIPAAPPLGRCSFAKPRR